MRDDPDAVQETPDLGGHVDSTRAEPQICPLLRAIGDEGRLGDPILWPDPANHCTARGDVAPQSLRQQESACLASAHVNCPRFWRGALVSVERLPAVGGTQLRLTPAILGALLVLAASFALSVGFVVANGGLDLPAAVSPSPRAAFASVAPGPSGLPASVAAATALPTPSTEASARTAVSPEPTLAATPAPSAIVTASPRPTSARYALLEPCPDAPDCWIYVVRIGDNLVSIARYFGVPLEVVIDLNPWTKTTQLVAGQELRLPPPTR